MYYINTSILDTHADGVIIPALVSGEIRGGSLHDMFTKQHPEYLAFYKEDIEAEWLKYGKPTLATPLGELGPDRTEPVVFHFPVGPDLTLPHVVKSMQEILDTCEQLGLNSLAIPYLTPIWSWETLETILLHMERTQKRDPIEFWFYPPEEDGEEPRVSNLKIVEAVTV